MYAPYAVCCEPIYFRPVDGDNGYQAEGVPKWNENTENWYYRLYHTWHAVARELERRGFTLIKVSPQPDLPDQVFAADQVVAAIKIWSEKVYGSAYTIPSNMNSPIRQREVALTVEALKKFGIYVGQEVTNIKHEGTGDFLYLLGHDFYVQGYGTRSEKGIGFTLSGLVNQLVVEVPLLMEKNNGGGLASKNTKGFHLDTIILPLPDKRIVACFERMAPETRALFEALYPRGSRIELTPEQADLFITNSLVVPALPEDGDTNGHTLLIPDTTPKEICDKLDNWGFGMKKFDFEPSKLSGGGLHCMFNFIFKINTGVSKPVVLYQKSGDKYDEWVDVVKPLPSHLRKGIKWQSMRSRKVFEPLPG